MTHGIVGRLVLRCIAEGKSLDDLTLEEYREESPVFENDIYDAISMETCVNTRLTIGAPSKKAMEDAIRKEEEYLSNDWKHE